MACHFFDIMEVFPYKPAYFKANLTLGEMALFIVQNTGSQMDLFLVTFTDVMT